MEILFMVLYISKRNSLGNVVSNKHDLKAVKFLNSSVAQHFSESYFLTVTAFVAL